jgi:uncharacterized MAPEG superfamily protein
VTLEPVDVPRAVGLGIFDPLHARAAKREATSVLGGSARCKRGRSFSSTPSAVAASPSWPAYARPPPEAARRSGVWFCRSRMYFIIVCLFIAATLPYVFLMLSGLPSRTERGRWGSDYDNHEARASLERLTGWRKRAHFAQLNGHEAFAPFAAAMICAQLAHGDESWVHSLAIGFIAFRLAHGAAYIANLGVARSVLWGGGISCVAGLFLTAARATT